VSPAADLAARIKAMAEIPSTFSPRYSRDGRRIASVSDRSGTPQVWTVDAAGGEPTQVTHGALPDGKRTPFAKLPGEVISVGDFSPDGSRVALTIADFFSPTPGVRAR
jgi:Tol biopolymer transport system component